MACKPVDHDAQSGVAVLIGRFLQVAQPYFLPTSRGSNGSQWTGLIIALFVFVVSGTFCLVTGFGSVLRAFLPTVLPSDAVQILAVLTSPQVLLAVLASLSFAAAVVWSTRSELAGRERQWLLLGLLLFLLFLLRSNKTVLAAPATSLAPLVPSCSIHAHSVLASPPPPLLLALLD